MESKAVVAFVIIFAFIFFFLWLVPGLLGKISFFYKVVYTIGGAAVTYVIVNAKVR